MGDGVRCSEEIESVENDEFRAFLKQLEPMPRKDLKEMYPHVEPAALELLTAMLRFDPNKRITPKEALESPFFEGMRRPDLEVGERAGGDV